MTPSSLANVTQTVLSLTPHAHGAGLLETALILLTQAEGLDQMKQKTHSLGLHPDIIKLFCTHEA